ncbi:MAG: hypothetical protein R6V01_03215 [Thermoplasmatota archaeon]
MKTSGKIGAVIVIATLIISTMGGVYIFSYLEGKEEKTRSGAETGTARQQLISLTHSTLSTMESMDMEEIERQIEIKSKEWISSNRVMVKDHIMTVLSVDVEAAETELYLDVPVPPGNLYGDSEVLLRNSMMYGGSGALPLLPAVRTRTQIRVLLEGDERSFEDIISYENEVVDPERGLLELIGIIEKDMNGWSSGMSRDMEYMLNTLARTRTKNDWGSGAGQSDLNVLNDGDVELAFNIALALRISRWTGQMPENLVNDIDAFFLDQDIEVVTNPTGLRIWGEAEKENYRETWRKAGTRLRRYLPDLISSALQAGHGDPADIFARYLFLDKWGRNEDLNMLDISSPLEDKNLLSEREPSDKTDAFALEHHTSFPDPEGIGVSPRDRFDEVENGTVHRILPRIEPDQSYMILGRDLQVKGLDEPRAWFTDSNPDLDASELVAVGGLPGERCGAIPPPQKPPGHNYRVQWDLRITGEMDLNGENEGYGGNVLNRNRTKSTISFDLPLRIHTWFDERPNNDGFLFENINQGRMYWTDLMTGWYITEESNATEIFEDKLYREIKQGVGLLTSQLRNMQWNMEMGIIDDITLRKIFQTQAMTLVKHLGAWSADPNIWSDLDLFWRDHIEKPGIHVEDLGTVMVEGHMFKFSYSDIKDRMDLTSKLPVGEIRISFFGPRSGENKVEAGLETGSGLRVDLRPESEEFSIRGTLGGRYIDDGPLDPKTASDQVGDLFIRSGWIARGPSFNIRTWSVPGQYLETDSSQKDNKLTMSFVLAGRNDQEAGPIVLEASSRLEAPDKLGEANCLDHLHEIADHAVQKDLWFGISVALKGTDMAHPVARDLLIKVNDMDIILRLLSSGALIDIVRGTIWGAGPHILSDISLHEEERIDIIMAESVPSWVTSVPTEFSSRELMFVSHHVSEVKDIVHDNEMLNVFSYEESSGRFLLDEKGWSSSAIEMPTLLW